MDFFWFAEVVEETVGCTRGGRKVVVLVHESKEALLTSVVDSSETVTDNQITLVVHPPTRSFPQCRAIKPATKSAPTSIEIARRTWRAMTPVPRVLGDDKTNAGLQLAWLPADSHSCVLRCRDLFGDLFCWSHKSHRETVLLVPRGNQECMWSMFVHMIQTQ